MSEHAHAAGADVESVATVEDCDALIVASRVVVSATQATRDLVSKEWVVKDIYLRPPTSKKPANSPHCSVGRTAARAPTLSRAWRQISQTAWLKVT